MTDRFDPPTAHCVSPEEIAALVAADEGDPGRQHLAECPRCRALARELESFLAEPEVVDAAAVAHLESALRREILGESPGQVIPAAGRFRAWWRPVLAVAAAALLVVVASNLRRDRNSDEAPLLRGATPDATAFRGVPTAAFEDDAAGDAAEDDANEAVDGVLVFRWDAQDTADAYRVELFNDALEPVRTLSADGETTLRWTPDLEDFELRTWLWRVVALERGDATRRSTLRTLAMTQEDGRAQ